MSETARPMVDPELVEQMRQCIADSCRVWEEFVDGGVTGQVVGLPDASLVAAAFVEGAVSTARDEMLRHYSQALAPYDRDTLVQTIIYHGRASIKGCRCGWAGLGKSHAEHVADVYEASVPAGRAAS